MAKARGRGGGRTFRGSLELSRKSHLVMAPRHRVCGVQGSVPLPRRTSRPGVARSCTGGNALGTREGTLSLSMPRQTCWRQRKRGCPDRRGISVTAPVVSAMRPPPSLQRSDRV